MDRSVPHITARDKVGMKAYMKTMNDSARSNQSSFSKKHAAKRAAKAAIREDREKFVMGAEDRNSHVMRYDAAVKKRESAKMGAEDSRSQRVAAAAKKKVVKSNVVSIKPKTDKKRKAFDPKLLFKRKR